MQKKRNDPGVIRYLNLRSGLGGNRRLLPENVLVTAIENNEVIAHEYQRQFPDDLVLIVDAHEYLRKHVNDFDFIWNSPNCQSHSKFSLVAEKKNRHYVDMALYQEILFLKTYASCNWVVENVKPYYKALVDPGAIIGRHYFWSNFFINSSVDPGEISGFIDPGTVSKAQAFKDWLGIQYHGNIYYGSNHCPVQVLRNCVHPNLGLHIFNCSLRNYESVFPVSQLKLFYEET